MNYDVGASVKAAAAAANRRNLYLRTIEHDTDGQSGTGLALGDPPAALRADQGPLRWADGGAEGACAL